MQDVMKKRDVLEVFAFSSPEGGGNPAGVVLDADGLTPAQMQEIAAKAGYSETAFVSRSKNAAGFRLDFFTPTRRIPDCGHATVAAFSVLKTRNPTLTETTKEIESGVRRIVIDGERVFMEQPLPAIRSLDAHTELFARLFPGGGRPATGVLARHDVGFALFELESEAALAALRPDLAAIKAYSEEHDLVGVYVFVKTPGRAAAATTRMFAPAYGIAEESATGMAAGLLAALLAGQGQVPDGQLTIEQGRHMSPPSPSLLFCRVQPAEKLVLVGGTARVRT
jgi:PhzF family phenazine biosynthesis protein